MKRFDPTPAPGGSRSITRRLRAALADVPHRYIARAGRVLGMVAYAADLRHRRIVYRNLRFTHPEWGQDEVRTLTRQVFQNAAMTFLEVVQMAFYTRADVLRKVRVRGEEHLRDAMKGPRKGAIVISGHLGNWEMAVVFASCYLDEPLVGVARKIRSRIVNAWVETLRTRFGNTILDKRNALPKMVRMLRQGRFLGILIDQGTIRAEGVEVTFFGKTTTATPAPALLARRYGHPVIPAFCVRETNGSLTLSIEPPLPLRRSKDLRADLVFNTQIMTDAVERAVRAHPEQWFWFHKRWKRHFPHLYPEDMAKRQRRREKRGEG